MTAGKRSGKSRAWVIGIATVPILAFLTWDLVTYGRFIDAFSGATPKALHHPPPGGLELMVDGRVERPWRVTTRSLLLLAPVRVRTREVSPDGRLQGAYAHTGVPVMHVLAGVDPRPLDRDPDDRPLDMLVVFTARDGRRAFFAYGELVLADDALPVTLAWKREPVLPERGAETYTGNFLTGELKGLRLICPRESDTSRYLDDVVRMTLKVPRFPRRKLPPVRKHEDCRSESITCIDGENSVGDVHLSGIPGRTWPAWFRIGHGMGIRNPRPAAVSGIPLGPLLARWFPGCGGSDFFLVSGCDGYRVLLSGREVFADPRGDRFLLVDQVDGLPPGDGIMMGVFGDFYIDRCVRGVSHVVRLSREALESS